MDEVKVLLSSKDNAVKIRESFEQMSGKLLDVNKRGTNSVGLKFGSIIKKFAEVETIFKNTVFLNCEMGG